jgi:tRNA (mo5U34)-methyltransferase
VLGARRRATYDFAVMSSLHPGSESDAPLAQQVREIRWFHTIDLPGSIRTPGLDDPARRLPRLQIPSDLRGRTVLDVGAWDGFYSFECERRGAARVVAADSFAWNGENWSSKAGFELARRALRSQVEDVELDVMDMSPARIGTFDLVLFLGVLYHLREPLTGLARVASVAASELIVETHVDALWTRRPAMCFYPGTTLGHDPTNWWGPNPAAVCAMLREVGFSEVTVVSPDTWAYRLGRGTARALRTLAARVRRRPRQRWAWSQGRAVIHARR